MKVNARQVGNKKETGLVSLFWAYHTLTKQENLVEEDTQDFHWFIRGSK